MRDFFNQLRTLIMSWHILRREAIHWVLNYLMLGNQNGEG